VLSTQNPVDLDYKALSNAGTWFIGRLQTEQDRNRVRDGLLSASAAEGLEPAQLDQILGSLGKRSFLLHNVHESGPLLMQTRWAMSYLRGPLTRDDIRRLSSTKPAAAPAALQPSAPAPVPVPPTAAPAAPPPAAVATRPLLSPDIPVLYGAIPQALAGQTLKPRLLAAARIAYLSSRHGVDLGKELVLALDPGDGAPDWATAEELDLDIAALGSEPPANATWAELPAALGNPKNYPLWKKQFQAWLRSERPLMLWRCPALGAISLPDESEGAFRARLQHLAREARDAQTDKLRRKHAARLTALTERLRRAEQAVEREKEQSAGAKLDAAVSAGSAILGALFGRRKLGATSMGRAATAMRKAGNVGKQSGDVQRAGETVASLGAQLEALEQQLQAEISALEDTLDAQASELEAVAIRPKAGDISIRFCGLAWLG
jgi:hypothetical protein